MRVSSFILLSLVSSGCGAGDFVCTADAAPSVQRVGAPDGTAIWTTGQQSGNGIIEDAAHLQGPGLCNARVSLTDLVSETRELDGELVGDDTIEVVLPRDMQRVDLALLLRANDAQTTVRLSLLDIDGTRRQLIVDSVSNGQ